ncbi:hypothetical protein [Saccharothrix sp. NRRL B-16314]|uniref:hypothetical protein n=1 Tax=Saccharothrix sp. NRRL B-16314 TaxID=1463825 RepID=UPI0005256853|nr:hypothetical protein [Saccharothrix sp. NRRL B-16314]
MSEWSDLNDEGVLLAADGDVVGARAALEAALAVAPAEDRAQCLLNLAHVVDFAGDRQHAVDLLTEAIAVGEGEVRAAAVASRADLLPWLGRWDEAWRDVEAALVDAGPPEQAVLRNTRVALLMMAGRLAEAAEEVDAVVGLVAEHAPEYLGHVYTNRAILAEEAGDGQRAQVYRMLADNRGQQQQLGPRWLRFVELNAEGALLASAGDAAGARAAFEAAYRETTELSDPFGIMKSGDPLAGTSAQRSAGAGADSGADSDSGAGAGAGAGVDVEALVCRAAVAGNLAGASADYDEALRWSTEAVDAARIVLDLVGDAYGTSTVLMNALVSRAVSYHALTRLVEALADLDEAVEVLATATATATASAAVERGQSVEDGHVEGGQVEGWQLFEVAVRSTRARVLVSGGWYAEAAAEARLALDLAYAAAPSSAANVHLTLAEVASSTGDLVDAVEHLTLARDLCAATGDVGGEATATLSLARLAYLASDADRADALYGEAEGLLVDDPHRLAACLCGRAAVAVLRGRSHEALVLLDRSDALLGPAMPLGQVAVQQIRGAAFETLGEFTAAESCYAGAAAACEAAGLWHVVLGMTWWRADALVRRAAAATGEERRAIGLRALDLALPAALASEAVRQRFPHGPLRERWVALASAPAIRSAFLAIRAVEDVPLAAEYIDHIAGAVSLNAVSLDAVGTSVERGELVMLPEPPAAEPPAADPFTAEPAVEGHLPYAASGLVTGGSVPAGGFELPPRVRLDPEVRTALDAWIDLAEERYGVPVRSERAVASW